MRPTAFTIGLIIYSFIALFFVYTEFGIDSIRLISDGSAEPVRVHDLALTQAFTPVSQRHSPFLRYLMCCKIQSLQERCIARKYTPLLVQTAIATVKALYNVVLIFH